mmetsp:Transcript_168677/g.542015  ORF Transcript_168677/g.542015 Transcript_168677/m.542015 type:complete len:526 (-) Transcript_168677:272-1849(-)
MGGRAGPGGAAWGCGGHACNAAAAAGHTHSGVREGSERQRSEVARYEHWDAAATEAIGVLHLHANWGDGHGRLRMRLPSDLLVGVCADGGPACPRNLLPLARSALGLLLRGEECERPAGGATGRRRQHQQHQHHQKQTRRRPPAVSDGHAAFHGRAGAARDELAAAPRGSRAGPVQVPVGAAEHGPHPRVGATAAAHGQLGRRPGHSLRHLLRRGRRAEDFALWLQGACHLPQELLVGTGRDALPADQHPLPRGDRRVHFRPQRGRLARRRRRGGPRGRGAQRAGRGRAQPAAHRRPQAAERGVPAHVRLRDLPGSARSGGLLHAAVPTQVLFRVLAIPLRHHRARTAAEQADLPSGRVWIQPSIGGIHPHISAVPLGGDIRQASRVPHPGQPQHLRVWEARVRGEGVPRRRRRLRGPRLPSGPPLLRQVPFGATPIDDVRGAGGADGAREEGGGGGEGPAGGLDKRFEYGMEALPSAMYFRRGLQGRRGVRPRHLRVRLRILLGLRRRAPGGLGARQPVAQAVV